jgi:hypothetical protein
MLAELRFRCARIQGTRRRLERQLRPPHTPSLLLPLFVLGVVGAVTTSNRDFAPTARAATVFGTEVVGDRVLVLVDDSGSMGGTDDAVQAQLTRLRTAGIELSNRATIPGFAVSVTDPYAMVPALVQGLAADRAIDTVYILSDFSAGDDGANDAGSIARVARLLREPRARIYWSSVRDVPAAAYYTIARESGGAVILMR